MGSLGDSISPDAAGDPLRRVALSRVRGTWGIAVVFRDHPGIVIAARNGSPLVVGIGEGETFLASDQHALVPYTRRVVYLQDGEFAVLDASGVQTWRLDGDESHADIETLEECGGC